MATRHEVRRLVAQRYWRESAARAVIEAWRQSGEPLAAFARRHGMPRQRLGRWVRRLAGSRRRVRFHPVRLVERDASEVVQGGGAPIEIEWASGRRVRVMPGFSGEDLARVLEILESGTRC